MSAPSGPYAPQRHPPATRPSASQPQSQCSSSTMATSAPPWPARQQGYHHKAVTNVVCDMHIIACVCRHAETVFVLFLIYVLSPAMHILCWLSRDLAAVRSEPQGLQCIHPDTKLCNICCRKLHITQSGNRSGMQACCTHCDSL